MAGKDPEKDHDLKAFLEAEYKYYWDWLKYQYDVREKYIQFFVAISAALGVLLAALLKEGDRNPGSTVGSENFRMIALITSVVAIVSLITFLKVLYERKTTIELKHKLNGIRGKLLKMAGGKDSLEEILYPTDPSKPKYLGGDPNVLRLVAFITALSGGFTVAFLCTAIFGFLAFWAFIILLSLYRNYQLSKWDDEDPLSQKKELSWWRRGIIGIILCHYQKLLGRAKSTLVNLNDRLGRDF